jgi:hypothetical protein
MAALLSEKLDPKETVTFEELLMSNVIVDFSFLPNHL